MADCVISVGGGRRATTLSTAKATTSGTASGSATASRCTASTAHATSTAHALREAGAARWRPRCAGTGHPADLCLPHSSRTLPRSPALPRALTQGRHGAASPRPYIRIGPNFTPRPLTTRQVAMRPSLFADFSKVHPRTPTSATKPLPTILPAPVRAIIAPPPLANQRRSWLQRCWFRRVLALLVSAHPSLSTCPATPPEARLRPPRSLRRHRAARLRVPPLTMTAHHLNTLGSVWRWCGGHAVSPRGEIVRRTGRRVLPNATACGECAGAGRASPSEQWKSTPHACKNGTRSIEGG